MTLPEGGIGTTLFYAAAFVAVSLLFFVGPRRGKAGSLWFGLSCLCLAGYAVFSLGMEIPAADWTAAAGAAACFLIGVWVKARHAHVK
ncbi:MAG: hypothetical protein HRF45_07710 [Fimbriimonadia bacterium]